MAVKEYIDDTYNRAMFSDSPPQPQTMNQGPSDNTGIMEGFEQTEEQQQGLIDQAQDLNGLVAATRGADIPEEELRNELLHAMIPSMGEDKAVAVAALISPQVLALAQPIVQAMYDDEGIMGLAEVEQTAKQAQVPMAQGMPQMDPNQMTQMAQGMPQMAQGMPQMDPNQMAQTQQVPGMKEGGIVSLATGGLAERFERKEVPSLTEQMALNLPAYQDIYGEGIDPETYKGLAKLQFAQMFLGWADPSKGRSFAERAVKSAQETLPSITALAMQKAKEESEAKQKAKIGSLDLSKKEIEDIRKRNEKIEDLETAAMLKETEVFDPTKGRNVKVSSLASALDRENDQPKYRVKRTYMTDGVATWNDRKTGRQHETQAFVWNDGGVQKIMVPREPGDPIEFDNNLQPMAKGGFKELDVSTVDNFSMKRPTSAQDMLLKPNQALTVEKEIFGMQAALGTATKWQESLRIDPTRAGIVGKFKYGYQEVTQMAKDVLGYKNPEERNVHNQILSFGNNADVQKRLGIPENKRSSTLQDDIFERPDVQQFKTIDEKIDYLAKDFGLTNNQKENFRKVAKTVATANRYSFSTNIFGDKSVSFSLDLLNSGDIRHMIVPVGANDDDPEKDKEIWRKLSTKDKNLQIYEETRKMKNLLNARSKESMEFFGESYDPELAKNRVRQNSVIYALARVRKTTGRLNLDDIKRAAAALDPSFISAYGIRSALSEVILQMEEYINNHKQMYESHTGRSFDVRYPSEGFPEGPMPEEGTPERETWNEQMEKHSETIGLPSGYGPEVPLTE